MEVLKVCHIVNWYPNSRNEKEAIWTRRHIDALNRSCFNEVFHVQVIEGGFKYNAKRISNFEQSYILSFPTRIWFFKELLTTLLLCYVLVFKMNRKKYDVFNFQITYPLLTYSKLISNIIKKPIVVTEHWSAYHFSFGVKKELKRIKRIFKNKKLKFICVSEALAKDIQNFSGEKIDYRIVPNTISKAYSYHGDLPNPFTFFMLSYWKTPKDPFLLLEVFEKLKIEGKQFMLTIGGYGPMIDDMEDKICEFGLEDNVKLIGVLEEKEIISQLNRHAYFLHNSNYEVASVVCSEALCCGTPVVASAVGGIVEYIDDTNGVLVDENNFMCWYEVINNIIVNNKKFDNNYIAEKAANRFHTSNIGVRYHRALVDIVKDFK